MKLYRYFEYAHHAREFLDGHIRFGNLFKYKHIEKQKKCDPTEGTSNALVNGVSHSIFLDNLIFILSTSSELSLELANSHGRYVVEIHNSSLFEDRLNQSLMKMGISCFGEKIKSKFVRYTKGDAVVLQHITDSIFQKSLSYSYEREFRYSFILKDNSSHPKPDLLKSHIYLDIDESDLFFTPGIHKF
jgi:hypothetical protein